MLDSIAIKKDTIKKPFIKTVLNTLDSIHTGRISFQYRYLSSKYEGQTINPNYFRVDIQNNISLLGIPLRNSINLTNEQNRLQYNVNRFQVDFNRDDLEKSLRDKLKKEVKAKLSRKDSLLNSYTEDKKVQKLLNDSLLEYQNLHESLLKQKDSILKQGHYDSVEYLKITKACKTLEVKQDSFTHRIRCFEDRFSELEGLLSNNTADSLNLLFKKGQTGDAYKRTDLIDVNSLQKLFLNFKGLGIGNVILRENNLAINSTMLRGGNIAIEKGNIYFSSAYGKLSSNNAFDNFNSPSLKSNIMILKGGYGRENENRIRYTFITANGNLGRGDYKQNTVQHVEGEIEILNGIKGAGEYSWSSTKASQENYQETSGDITPFNLFSAPNVSHSLKVFGSLDKTNTQFSIEQKQVGAKYFSAANSFQRNDWMQYFLYLKQTFFKRKVQVTYQTKFANDNQLNNKSNTSNTRYQKADVDLRFHKSIPAIKLTYASNLVGNSEYKNLLSKSSIYGATMSYSREFTNGTLYNTSISYNNTVIEILTTANIKSVVKSVFFNQAIVYKKVESSMVFSSIAQKGLINSDNKTCVINTGYRYKGVSKVGMSMSIMKNSLRGYNVGVGVQGNHQFQWGMNVGYSVLLNKYYYTNVSYSSNQCVANILVSKQF